MITNLVVLLTGGFILFDQAGWIVGVSYGWLAVMFLGWGFLNTAYNLGVKKRESLEQKEQLEDAFKKLFITMGAMKDSNNSEKH